MLNQGQELRVREIVKDETEWMRSHMKDLKRDTEAILQHLSGSDTVEANSPRALTDFGKEVSKLAEANTWGRHRNGYMPKLIEREMVA